MLVSRMYVLQLFALSANTIYFQFKISLIPGCTVNALAFTADGTHLISGGDDGTIAVTRTGSWFVEKLWTGTHSGSGNFPFNLGMFIDVTFMLLLTVFI